MKYVYLLESIAFPNEVYVGLTDDLRKRVAAHNDGLSTHTRKFKPWRLVVYMPTTISLAALATNLATAVHVCQA